LADTILTNFDPERLQKEKISKLEGEEQKVQAKIDRAENKYEKWDLLEKKIEKEEEKEEAIKNQEKGIDSHKIMGCSRDHSKEIEIYSKTF